MATRHPFWVIVDGATPTSFRSRRIEDLLPTLKQLQRTSPTAVLRWFDRGRFWESPAAARDALRVRRETPTGRGREWRPGGSHVDPRDKYKRTRDEKRAAFKRNHGYQGSRPERPVGQDTSEKPALNWKPAPSAKPSDAGAPTPPPAAPPNWKPASPGRPRWKPASAHGSKPAWKPKGSAPSWKPKGQAPDWRPKGSGSAPAWKPPRKHDGSGSASSWRPASSSRPAPSWKPKGSAPAWKPKGSAPSWKPKGSAPAWKPKGSAPSWKPGSKSGGKPFGSGRPFRPKGKPFGAGPRPHGRGPGRPFKPKNRP